LAREQAQAQRYLQAIEQAVQELGLLTHVADVIRRKRKAQEKWMEKIVGMMFSPLFGCRTSHELSRVQGWDQNLPLQILGALPKREWVQQVQRLGQELLASLGPQVEDKSPATRGRGHGRGWPMARCSRSTAPSWAWSGL
jgi:hypothetical protein